MGFTHFDTDGNAWMVDVSNKEQTTRIAVAEGFITVNEEILALIKAGQMKKGDVLSVAQIAAIMGAKKTSELIPLCHPLMLSKVEVHCHIIEDTKQIKVHALVKTTGQTGVEMEALTAVQVGLLTIYDMCKAVDKRMVMGPVYLVEKEGGKSGHFIREDSAV